MNITDGTVASFHYQIKDSQQNLLEDAMSGDPALYLHGADNILPALEAKLEGAVAGDVIEVTLTAKEAYGEHNPELQQRIPKKHLNIKKNQTLKLGDIVSINTRDGQRQGRVIKAGKFQVDLDTNHPFAGMDLYFTVKIVDVREATDDEKQHNHAHGPGGHHH
jgi:FKBP-type peptidyl-prolyl cis-trans isomerase SlyD